MIEVGNSTRLDAKLNRIHSDNNDYFDYLLLLLLLVLLFVII